MEKFESAKILKALSKEKKVAAKIQNQQVKVYETSNVVSKVWTVDCLVPSKEALLVLKASHIYFPVNWRKNCKRKPHPIKKLTSCSYAISLNDVFILEEL